MTNSSTLIGRRQADWAEFYKNGPPKEVIVIDDDTPPPPSLSSSSTSSSSSAQHVPNGDPSGGSPRYRVVQPQVHATHLYHHTGTTASQVGPSSIPVATGRVTRRTNKRQPSTDLGPSGSNGPSSSSSHVPNQHYTYPQTSYAPIHHAHPATIYSDSTLVPHPVLGKSPNGGGVVQAPVKKKRRSNAEVKYVQPRPPQENQAPYYPPAPPGHANNAPAATAAVANRDAPLNIPPWDDKEGHYIVVANDDFTSRCTLLVFYW
ncbi:hypothetical protein EDD21DRAFT_422097 [Dissophora ornata]|nr:hypothetical protein EDD21DRAFT_422097 [Dissophora ornata]